MRRQRISSGRWQANATQHIATRNDERVVIVTHAEASTRVAAQCCRERLIIRAARPHCSMATVRCFVPASAMREAVSPCSAVVDARVVDVVMSRRVRALSAPRRAAPGYVVREGTICAAPPRKI